MVLRRIQAGQKVTSFNTRRSWFGPVLKDGIPRKPALYGGAAGYCPRVRCVYCTTPFIAIAGEIPSKPNIGRSALMGSERVEARVLAGLARILAKCVVVRFDLPVEPEKRKPGKPDENGAAKVI